MKRISRLLFVLALVLALLPVRAVSAQDFVPPVVEITNDLQCASLALPGGSTISGVALSGSKFCITLPPGGAPGVPPPMVGLVIFAHGYVFDYPPNLPPVIPYGQLVVVDPVTQTQTSIPALVNGMSFAFATTSYSQNGLAVEQGVENVAELVDVVKAVFLMSYGFPAPDFPVYLIGASEGGLVTALAVEKHSNIFDGGVATCGPVGDFRKQVDYWGDFRVLFDVYFHKNALGDDPMAIPGDVMDNWGTFAAPGPVMLNTIALVQEDLDKKALNVQRLLTAAQAPIDPFVPETVMSTILGILDYNVMATNQAVEELGGIPFSNLERVYTPFPADPSVNKRVERIAADPAALAKINASYQTSGALQVPLVLMHTALDPIVPAWHMGLYAAKAFAQGSSNLIYPILIPRYGHCQFTQAEAVFAFEKMLILSGMQGLSQAQVQGALPGAQEQQMLQELRADFTQ